MKLFDIVIPLGPHDLDVIENQLEYTKKNIIGYRNIYLVSCDPSIHINGCITINEDIFPFTLSSVAGFHGKLSRNGWYLQQLIKLYSGKIIPNILERYLVVDADTFFLKPTTFIRNGACLYSTSSENHRQYFRHMLKLDKGFVRVDRSKSGIVHHMMFETKYINEIIAIVENNHQDTFYNVFLKSVTDYNGSGASEYEIYFNYIYKNHRSAIVLRRLRFKNVGSIRDRHAIHQDYVSCHHYIRRRRGNT